jgi:hypothetical protein
VVERMKAEGRKFPGGRRRGADRVTSTMRELPAAAAQLTFTPAAAKALTVEERIRAARDAIDILIDRFSRTGSLFES